MGSIDASRGGVRENDDLRRRGSTPAFARSRAGCAVSADAWYGRWLVRLRVRLRVRLMGPFVRRGGRSVSTVGWVGEMRGDDKAHARHGKHDK
jgi:hypothetical protein